MGLGDDLMITAFAENEKKKYPDKQIVIGNLDQKKIFDSLIYINNPSITPIKKIDRTKPIHFINYHSSNRPYIDYKNSSKNNRKWNYNFNPVPGKIYFTKEENNEAKKILNAARDHWKKNNKKRFKGLIFLVFFIIVAVSGL